MSKSLLIVDDNQVERTALATALIQAGYPVSCASDGQEALDFLRGETPDLILLDMMMPQSDGWRFLEEKKRNPQLERIPTLIVTGLAIASDTWARNLGASGLVKKPVDLEALLAQVQRLLA